MSETLRPDQSIELEIGAEDLPISPNEVCRQTTVFVYHALILDQSRTVEHSLLIRSLSGPITQPDNFRGLIVSCAQGLDVADPEDILIRSLSFLHTDALTEEEADQLRQEKN